MCYLNIAWERMCSVGYDNTVNWCEHSPIMRQTQHGWFLREISFTHISGSPDPSCQHMERRTRPSFRHPAGAPLRPYAVPQRVFSDSCGRSIHRRNGSRHKNGKLMKNPFIEANYAMSFISAILCLTSSVPFIPDLNSPDNRSPLGQSLWRGALTWRDGV